VRRVQQVADVLAGEVDVGRINRAVVIGRLDVADLRPVDDRARGLAEDEAVVIAADQA